MLSRENYTEIHINDLRAQTGADPSILERTVFAFGLLDSKVFKFEPGWCSYLVTLADGLKRVECVSWRIAGSPSTLSFSLIFAGRQIDPSANKRWQISGSCPQKRGFCHQAKIVPTAHKSTLFPDASCKGL